MNVGFTGWCLRFEQPQEEGGEATRSRRGGDQLGPVGPVGTVGPVGPAGTSGSGPATAAASWGARLQGFLILKVSQLRVISHSVKRNGSLSDAST